MIDSTMMQVMVSFHIGGVSRHSMNELRVNGNEECTRFAQAVLFLGQELDLPVKIPCGAGSSEERAMEMLATLSENLISEANSTVIINDEDEVVFIRLSPPESLNLKAGDIVAPPPIIVGRRSNWLARSFGFALEVSYPQGYFVALAKPDCEGDIFLESLSNGERRYYPAQGWVKVRFAGLRPPPRNIEDEDNEVRR